MTKRRKRSLNVLTNDLARVGDIGAPIGCSFLLRTDTKLSDLVDYDRGLLAICSLEARAETHKLAGVVVKSALYYARNSDEQIPRALRPSGSTDSPAFGSTDVSGQIAAAGALENPV